MWVRERERETILSIWNVGTHSHVHLLPATHTGLNCCHLAMMFMCLTRWWNPSLHSGCI